MRMRKGPAPGVCHPCRPAQAPPHTWGDPPPEEEAAPQDLLVLLEGDVPAHHVIEQHAQGPDGGRAPVVAVVADPLRRAVHPGAWGTRRVRTPAPSGAVSPERSVSGPGGLSPKREPASHPASQSSAWKNPAGVASPAPGGEELVTWAPARVSQQTDVR